MRSKVKGCACTHATRFVLDCNGDLWWWASGGAASPNRYPEELPPFTSVVAGYKRLALLDIDGNIWFRHYGSSTVMKQVKGVQEIESVALITPGSNSPSGFAYNMIALDTSGVAYRVNTERSLVEQLVGPKFDYIDADQICAALDCGGDLYVWSGVEQPRKLEIDMKVMDFIVEGAAVKFLDMEGKLWKFSIAEEVQQTFRLFPNAPPFKLLYGSGTHGFALSNDDVLYGWGKNDRKQVGVDAKFVPAPVAVQCEHKWKFISCGDGASLLISDEGDVYEWGQPHSRDRLTTSVKITHIEKAFVGRVYAKSARK